MDAIFESYAKNKLWDQIDKKRGGKEFIDLLTGILCNNDQLFFFFFNKKSFKILLKSR